MFISLKTKIWLTVITIVLLFTFFTLFYFPAQQHKALMKNYNNDVQNLANTVALGVRIALNEQNYEGVKTAMEFVNGNPGLKFVALMQSDTIWNAAHNQYHIKDTIFKTVPDSVKLAATDTTGSAIIIKRAPFTSSLMSGAIVLGFSTDEITESQNAIRRTSLQVSGLIFIIGMLIGLWLSRRISVPVLALRDAAERVSKGDLTAEVKSFSYDEIGDLAKAFNRMVRDLAAARANLNQSNQTLSDTNAALNHTLNDLKATQAQLVQSEKMASLGELTAGIAHEIQNPLNFINNFSEVNAELIAEIKEEIKAGNLSEIISVANDIEANEQKISYHGKRADAIVKNLFHHIIKNAGEKQPTDVNALADEYLRLSYHGLRSKDKSFNAAIKTNFDDTIGKINVVPQDVGRVLLNLFNNAFYAVNEKKKQQLAGYEPTVSVFTKRFQDKIEIKVQDNGMGISKSSMEKIFQPFFTTKPTGEGTGLGLSLSYDIVNAHGGELKVTSEENEGTCFTIILPAQKI
jgi:two-component system NtrC family sensor kinase